MARTILFSRVLFLFSLLFSGSIQAQVFVDINAGGNNDGSSWTDAYTDLAVALNNTSNGEIWVAEGTYVPLDCNPCSQADRETAFNIPPGVQLYGGFTGGETQLSERDWNANPTILSGDTGTPTDSTDNTYRVLIAENSLPTTLLDGFIIEEGNADGSFGFSAGGGLLMDANPNGTAHMQVRNCTFRNNYGGGGGALAIDCVLGGESEALIQHCVFEGNTASLQVVSTGAGVFIQGNSGAQVKPRFVGCTFTNNYSGNDGGAFSATPTGEGSLLAFVIDSCLFENNRADDRGAAVWYRMSSSGESRVVIKNSQFLSNTSGGQGAGVYARSSFDNVANDTLINCLFSQNSTDGSSGINDGEGGAVFLRGSQDGIRNHHIINCVFDRNSASERGGALASSSIVANPGMVDAEVTNCTFYGNTTNGEGGAVFAEGSQGVNSMNFSNCIFWRDSTAGGPDEIAQNGAVLNLVYCNVEGGVPAGVFDGGNNTDLDPQFARPEEGDLHLTACSPLINAGNNAALPTSVNTDLDGDDRIHEGIVDLGAYEIGVIHVDESAAGANNGSSWNDAFTDLQDGIAKARSGDQIWVADGTYYPTTCAPCQMPDREVFFPVKRDVEMYGGFNATETALSQRNWNANPTILSGDIGISSDSTDNSFRVLIAENSTSKTILDGFIIEEGNADGSFGFSAGGGLLMDANPNGTAHMQVRNCIFRNNYGGGGGALAIDCVLGGESEALIQHCVFEGNTASLQVVSTGAAVFMQGNSGAQVKPRFVGCTFTNNYSGNDGGAFSATPTGSGSLLAFVIDSCLFENNRADDRGAAVWYRMSSSGESRVVIKNSQFLSNTCGGQGAGIYARSSFDNVANDTLINCLFSQNSTDGSSGINDGEGGAVFLRGSQDGIRNHHIINCVFDRNSASERGGALASSSIVANPGMLNAEVINCTFYGNTTDGEGGAVHAEGSEGMNSMHFFNSIFWEDEAQGAENELFSNNSDLSLSHCIITGGVPADVNDGGNNSDEDPQFLDPENSDLRISGCSPARDAGLNAALPTDLNDLDGDSIFTETLPLDFASQDRIFGDTVDIGAYEYNGDPPPLQMALNGVDVSCNDLCDGEASASLSGGVPAYTYSWSTGEDTPDITGLCAGTYYVTVSDDFNCTLTDSVVIRENPPLVAVASPDTSVCPGQPLQLVAAATGGDSTYTFSWDNGLGEGDTLGITPGITTNYQLTATDGAGCTDVDTITVEVFDNPQPQITGSLTYCEGGSTVLDGGAGFSAYEWSNGSTDPLLEVSVEGTYGLTVTDVNGCMGTDEVTVTETDALQPVIAGEPSFCGGASTILDAGPFAGYEWSSGEMSQTIMVSTAGAYSVTVSDGAGCTGSDTLTVVELDNPQPQITGSLTFCEGGSTVLDGGAGFSAYEWSDGSTDPLLEVSAEGTYGLTVTDANGCTGTDEVTVTETDALQPVIAGEPSFCGGASTILDAGPFTGYQWSSGEMSQTISVSSAGAYSVTVSDGSGCTGSDTLTVVELDNPQPQITGSLTFCEGGSTTLDGGAGFSAYEWSDGSTDPLLEVTQEGMYGLTVTDVNGCTGSTSAGIEEIEAPVANDDQIVILAGEPSSIELNLLQNDEVEADDFGLITLLTQPDLGAVDSLAGGVLYYSAPLDLSGIDVLMYRLCSEACPELCSEATVTIRFEATALEEADIPNAITPNGDGANDLFVVQLLETAPDRYPGNELIVFNRWGDVVFQQRDYDNSWDGVNRQGEDLPQGTYYYLLKLDIPSGVVVKGDITILR